MRCFVASIQTRIDASFRFNFVIRWQRSVVFYYVNIGNFFHYMSVKRVFCSIFECFTLGQLAILLAIFETSLQTLLPHVISACDFVITHCVTSFASRWISTILSSSFGAYPERSQQGTMTAVLLSTSVATLSANIYTGTYTVSTSPAQQSRLYVAIAAVIQFH
jgi:hypothetical protein